MKNIVQKKIENFIQNFQITYFVDKMEFLTLPERADILKENDWMELSKKFVQYVLEVRDNSIPQKVKHCRDEGEAIHRINLDFLTRADTISPMFILDSSKVEWEEVNIYIPFRNSKNYYIEICSKSFYSDFSYIENDCIKTRREELIFAVWFDYNISESYMQKGKSKDGIFYCIDNVNIGNRDWRFPLTKYEGGYSIPSIGNLTKGTR